MITFSFPLITCYYLNPTDWVKRYGLFFHRKTDVFCWKPKYAFIDIQKKKKKRKKTSPKRYCQKKEKRELTKKKVDLAVFLMLLRFLVEKVFVAIREPFLLLFGFLLLFLSFLYSRIFFSWLFPEIIVPFYYWHESRRLFLFFFLFSVAQ